MKILPALIVFAITLNIAESVTTIRKYLSGEGPADAVDWEFMCSKGRRSGEWLSIPVPSHWEQHGFGNYNYGHDNPKHDEVGYYRHAFYIPEAWNGRKVRIIFEGAMTDTKVHINGNSAGPVHQGGFYRFHYDISDLLKFGADNLLEVEVSKVSANESVEQAERKADYWVFGGIYRPVYLEAYPESFIERVAIDARADGAITADVFLVDAWQDDRVVSIVETLSGESICENMNSDAQGEAEVKLYGRAFDPLLWTAETPNLHRLRVQLWRNGELVHEIVERFGFRTIEFRVGDGFYVNNVKVTMKGVNRHSFRPEHGRALNPGDCLEDVLAIKAMNANAVRCAHYPPRKEFLEYCDEVGLYVLHELSGWQKPPLETAIAQELIKSMVTRDVNHPSVFAWANGNEGGGNHDVDDDFAKYDPQARLVIHPWKLFRGLDTDHYEPYASHLRLLQGPNVYLPTEFLHGLYDGGHGAGLRDYWNAIVESPFGAGGFLWVWADEGLARTDRSGDLDTDGNHAPDGIVGPNGEREASYYTIREIWSLVQIDASLDDDEVYLTIRNHYDFESLGGHTYSWSLDRYPEITTNRENSVRTMRADSGWLPDIAPKEAGSFSWSLPSVWRECDALRIIIYNKEGAEVIAKVIPLNRLIPQPEKHVSPAVKLVTEDELFHFESSAVRVSVCRNTGVLKAVSIAGRAVDFGEGPFIFHSDESNAPAEGDSSVSAEPVDEGYVVNVSRDGFQFSWTILPGGLLDLSYEFDLAEGAYQHYGVGFHLAEEVVASKQWVGAGPDRVWNNRMEGPQHGYWDTPYNDGVPGYQWEAPVFKGVFRDVHWMNLQLHTGVQITVVPLKGPTAVGVLQPRNGPAPMNATFAYPQEGGLHLFHRIPATGTKFNEAEKLGPQSIATLEEGVVRGAIRLMFARLY